MYFFGGTEQCKMSCNTSAKQDTALIFLLFDAVTLARTFWPTVDHFIMSH